MIRLLKHEVFKLRKSKVLWIVLLLGVALGLLFGIIMQAVGGTSVDMGPGMEAMVIPKATGAYGMQLAASDLLVILASVLIAAIVCAEYQRNTIRNIAACGVPRWQIYTVKLIVCAAATLALFFVILGTLTGFLSVLNGFGDVGFGKYTLTLLNVVLQVVALSVVTTFIADLTRSTGATIGISIGMVSVFMGLVTIVSMAVSGTLLTAVEFIGELYPGYGMYKAAEFDLSAGKALRLLAMGICSTVIFTFGGIFLFTKRDLK